MEHFISIPPSSGASEIPDRRKVREKTVLNSLVRKKLTERNVARMTQAQEEVKLLEQKLNKLRPKGKKKVSPEAEEKIRGIEKEIANLKQQILVSAHGENADREMMLGILDKNLGDWTEHLKEEQDEIAKTKEWPKSQAEETEESEVAEETRVPLFKSPGFSRMPADRDFGPPPSSFGWKAPKDKAEVLRSEENIKSESSTEADVHQVFCPVHELFWSPSAGDSTWSSDLQPLERKKRKSSAEKIPEPPCKKKTCKPVERKPISPEICMGQIPNVQTSMTLLFPPETQEKLRENVISLKHHPEVSLSDLETIKLKQGKERATDETAQSKNPLPPLLLPWYFMKNMDMSKRKEKLKRLCHKRMIAGMRPNMYDIKSKKENKDKKKSPPSTAKNFKFPKGNSGKKLKKAAQDQPTLFEICMKKLNYEVPGFSSDSGSGEASSTVEKQKLKWKERKALKEIIKILEDCTRGELPPESFPLISPKKAESPSKPGARKQQQQTAPAKKAESPSKPGARKQQQQTAPAKKAESPSKPGARKQQQQTAPAKKARKQQQQTAPAKKAEPSSKPGARKQLQQPAAPEIAEEVASTSNGQKINYAEIYPDIHKKSFRFPLRCEDTTKDDIIREKQYISLFEKGWTCHQKNIFDRKMERKKRKRRRDKRITCLENLLRLYMKPPRGKEKIGPLGVPFTLAVPKALRTLEEIQKQYCITQMFQRKLPKYHGGVHRSILKRINAIKRDIAVKLLKSINEEKSKEVSKKVKMIPALGPTDKFERSKKWPVDVRYQAVQTPKLDTKELMSQPLDEEIDKIGKLEMMLREKNLKIMKHGPSTEVEMFKELIKDPLVSLILTTVDENGDISVEKAALEDPLGLFSKEGPKNKKENITNGMLKLIQHLDKKTIPEPLSFVTAILSNNEAFRKSDPSSTSPKNAELEEYKPAQPVKMVKRKKRLIYTRPTFNLGYKNRELYKMGGTASKLAGTVATHRRFRLCHFRWKFSHKVAPQPVLKTLQRFPSTFRWNKNTIAALAKPFEISKMKYIAGSHYLDGIHREKKEETASSTCICKVSDDKFKKLYKDIAARDYCEKCKSDICPRCFGRVRWMNIKWRKIEKRANKRIKLVQNCLCNYGIDPNFYKHLLIKYGRHECYDCYLNIPKSIDNISYCRGAQWAYAYTSIFLGFCKRFKLKEALK
ncbi:hypothetical protein O3M35_000773 [Rhynocoris fuscipes]|uniref:Uncharacterized protein n=1 Tax=Rhynocoris fuscipes TaxID=488301 RepID=A0AAW1DSL1_9HEMI